MKKLIIVVVLFGGFLQYAISQNEVDSLLNQGNIFYKDGQFNLAATTWENAAKKADNKIYKQEYYLYTSMAYASALDSINSFRCLEKSINEFGFNDIPALKSEETFDFMKQSNRWLKVINSIKPVYTTNPNEVKIIDTDVENFWKAYDKAIANPSAEKDIYKTDYFDIGTNALQFYYAYKISTLENFLLIHDLKKKYYASIKKSTLEAKQFKEEYQKSFVKLKEIYPNAIFPPIYFVIGKLNSAGTVSSDGLILAIDQACISANTDTTELSDWQKNNISSLENLPHTVAHELIHFEQSNIADDTTLLRAAIIEGMADFIGELISGKTANERLHVFAKGKEKDIWKDFKKEMYLDRGSNWIANSDQETIDKPADLGYWVGYQICKSYYNETPDKKKAVYEMLHIQDFNKFLEKSKIQDKLD
jgi:Predicted Zn-dependent protease (DUF2268)